ncbi:hypothetical protein [Microbulbifer sp. VAAF005]|uniref:hypothetical protein n=1 Tax=Microbulbifer sp. VAAF005 TaxID=3034230 RepID=UPI0024AE340A|nr:hypothetical protein [Microbulbifer sp. VAAF005]WHI48948.1 hypothetical protein P0078_11530 [Microbulbifer sp. VAAF005]
MWHPSAKFPESLKNASGMEKIEYFKSGFFMKHDAVNCAYEHLQELFFDSLEKDVVLVQGPTGVGKTCLSEYLMREAYKNVDVINEQVNELPMIYVEADVLGEQVFLERFLFRAS